MRNFWAGVALLSIFAVSSFLSPVYAGSGSQSSAPEKSAPARSAPVKTVKNSSSQVHGKAMRPGEKHDFRGHDYKHFTDHEREMWHGGAWHHATFHGRYGYWWAVGGVWYFFDQPVYPYPMVVPAVAFEVAPSFPVVAQQPTLVIQPQTQQFLYWCDSPRGYSPEVESCPPGWRKVPVQKTPTAPPPPPR